MDYLTISGVTLLGNQRTLGTVRSGGPLKRVGGERRSNIQNPTPPSNLLTNPAILMGAFSEIDPEIVCTSRLGLAVYNSPKWAPVQVHHPFPLQTQRPL